jgi:hypothetical protein
VTTVNGTSMSVLDAAKLIGAKGQLLNVAEMLSQKKGMLEDIPFVPTDAPESHLSAQRTSLPTVSDVVYNEAIAGSKSTVANIIETTQGARCWLVPDDDVLNYGGNPGGKMAKELASAVESMKQTVQTRYITGNGDTTPGQMYGFQVRLSSLSSNAARNIIDCDGTGTDNASIYYVRWSPETIYGLYPMGTPAGLSIEDFGRQAVTSSSGERVVHKHRLSWFFGLSIDDWRQAGRLCNIDVPALLAGTGADLLSRMRDLMSVIEDNSHGKGAFYMNRTVHAALARQARVAVQAGGGLTFANVDGHVREEFDGVPIRIIDAMPITESRVT